MVDEEHDGSYKQDGDPRYDARAVAERRAGAADCVLLAGSATPRPESFQRHRRLELAERVDGQPLPPVELVGMAGVSDALHPRTRDALGEVAARGEKAMVLLNRRGWSNFLTCAECGRVWQCPDCDVSLVLHRASGRVSCHHCGHRERVPERCPDCDSVSLRRHGLGTEQLGAELERLVAPLPVMRLDADTVAADGVAATLERFEAAPSGVLVGTQMVAKGHDFAGVTLGVVLDADNTLRFPDFRAEERTFALVAQLAGRSGRGSNRGRVVVQALDPDARALQYAARHDSRASCAASWPAARRSPTRRSATSFGSSARVPSPAPSTRPPPRCASACHRPARRCSVPSPCSGARGRTAPSSWSAARTARARSPPCGRRSRRWCPASAAGAWRSPWTWTRSRGSIPQDAGLVPLERPFAVLGRHQPHVAVRTDGHGCPVHQAVALGHRAAGWHQHRLERGGSAPTCSMVWPVRSASTACSERPSSMVTSGAASPARTVPRWWWPSSETMALRW